MHLALHDYDMAAACCKNLKLLLIQNRILAYTALVHQGDLKSWRLKVTPPNIHLDKK